MELKTIQAIQSFLNDLKGKYDIDHALLYGSRARGTHQPESDADVAIILKGEPQDLLTTKMDMVDIAYDTLMKTGLYISPLPIWTIEWENPDEYDNPYLLYNIKNDGVAI